MPLFLSQDPDIAMFARGRGLGSVIIRGTVMQANNLYYFLMTDTEAALSSIDRAYTCETGSLTLEV